MKRIIALLVLAGTFGAASTASAHTLSATRAGWAAESEAKLFADDGEGYSWGSCSYRSAHQRRCVIASYDGYVDTTCDAYVYVTFTSRFSKAVRTSNWKDVDCYDGDEYGLAAYADGSSE